MLVKKTKRAVVPPLAAVLPHVTLKEFHAGKAGAEHRLALLAAWAKASPKAPASYLVKRMRRDYGLAPAWVEAFECVRKARNVAHGGSKGRPVGVVAKPATRKPRSWRDYAPTQLEDALTVLRDAARRLGVSITISAAVPA